MSAALVTDQNPFSSGYSLISDQWTGQRPRNSLKTSYGGPSSQCSRSVTSRASRSERFIPASCAAVGLFTAGSLTGWPANCQTIDSRAVADRSAQVSSAEGRGEAPGRGRLDGRRILVVGGGQEEHGLEDAPIGNGR